MKRRYKIAGAVLLFIALAVATLALVLSHDSPCGPAPALASGAATMKAIVYRCYGAPDVLRFEEVEKPVPADNEVLVKVRAASVNPLDWHFMRGAPYVMRLDAGIGAPKNPRLGMDFSGTIESVGKSVTRFKPGDEVFGSRNGAFAEYVRVREDRALMLKPANVTHEQAAAVPIAAVTALQALRDHGHLKPGQKVLINGASGGVGTFAVQIAKSYGAEVTGVCSTRNVQLVRSLGADHVVDYTQQDFIQGDQRYDLILDTVGNRPLLDYRRVLTPSGIFVIVGGPSDNPWIGPLTVALKAKLLSPFVGQEFKFFMAKMNPQDLHVLGELMQSGKVTPVIDQRFPLRETPAAIRHVETGHARGKVIVTME